MTATPLVIAAAADNRYALPLAVMLRSVVANFTSEGSIDVYVVDDGIEPAEQGKIVASLPASVSLHWVKRPLEEFAGLPNWGRMALTTYYKLTLAEWLPSEIQKVIWLDCDALVLGDLAQLWESDLADHIVLAAQDVVVPLVSSRFGVAAYEELGLEPTWPYFNAGVLLINLARWRSEKVAARAFDYLRSYHKQVVFWDQEALNAALAGRWGKLDPRWNWNPVVDRLTSGKCEADPWIVHFSGNLKPWQYRGLSPRHAQYYEYLDQTAWRGWRPKRSWRGRALAAYESSSLRALLYPLEQFHLRLVRLLTRR